MKWESVPFGSLYQQPSRNGLSKPSRVRGSGVKMVNMGELFAHDRIFDIPMELVPVTEKELSAASLEQEDLLFARQSLVLEGAGKCSIVKEITEPTVFESHLIRVRLDSAKAIPEFYYYYFKSPLSPIKSIVSQCAQAGIKATDLAALSVSCPPLAVQKKIADALALYDSLIENNRRQIKLLEEAAQRLYKEWFVDLRFPGHDHTPIINGIPQGWSTMNVEDACSVLKRGITPKYDERAELMVINQKCIRSSIVSLDEARKHSKVYAAELGVQDGDTLICSTGTGTLGRVGCVHGEYKNTTIDSHVTLVRADKHITNKHYLYHFLKSNQPFLMQSGKGSTNQQELYKEVIGQLKLILPERTLLQKFDVLVSAIHQKTSSLNSSLKLLSEARDRLLPKLMSGEVEV